MIEKEFKFKIQDPAETEEKLKLMEAKLISNLEQVDIYLDKDEFLKKNDSALKLRFEGERRFLIYKGKLLNEIPKIREEISVELNHEQVENILNILNRLGFKEVLKIRKKRKTYVLEGLKFFLDEVENLGHFLEVELTNEDDLIKLAPILRNLGLKFENALNKTYPAMLKI